MSRFRIALIIFVMALLTSVFMSGQARAFGIFSDVCNSNYNGSASSSTCTSSPTSNPLYGSESAIAKATKIIAILSGIAAVIMIIIGGFQFITSSGDAQRVATARQSILYAVIGLIIAGLAQSIVMFVIYRK